MSVVKWMFCLCKMNLTERAVPRVCVSVKTVAGNIHFIPQSNKEKASK